MAIAATSVADMENWAVVPMLRRSRPARSTLPPSTKAARSIRMLRRTLSLVIAIAAGLLLFLIGPFGAIRKNPSRAELLVIGVILVVALIARLASTRNTAGRDITRIDLSHARNENQRLAAAAKREFNTKFTEAEVLMLLEFIIEPSAYIMRISEQIELGDEAYVFKTTQTLVDANATGAERVLVPVLTPPKGALVDNLRISCDSDVAVRTLSYRETLGAVLTMGEIMVDLVLGTVPKDLWKEMTEDILRERVAHSSEMQAMSKRIHGITEGLTSADARVLRNFLHNFISDIQATFPIIAVVPAAKEIKLKVGFTEDRTRVGGRESGGGPISFWEWVYSYIRSCFGLVRRSHMIRLTRATRTQSYHLRTEAPEGMYIYDLGLGMAEITDTDSVHISSSSYTHRPIDPRWDCEDTRGLTYVHAYGRDLDVLGVAPHLLDKNTPAASVTESRRRNPVDVDPRPHIPSMTIELREKPPGLMFVLVLLSLYLMALSIGVGHWHDMIFGFEPSSRFCMDFPYGAKCDSSPTTQSYWATILFGVPALISGWLVSRFTSEAVSRISVSTLAVASWFVVNSVFAMILSALKLARRMSTEGPVLLLGTNQPLWAILMISTSGCAVMTLLLLTLRVRRYRRRSTGTIKRKISR